MPAGSRRANAVKSGQRMRKPTSCGHTALPSASRSASASAMQLGRADGTGIASARSIYREIWGSVRKCRWLARFARHVNHVASKQIIARR